MTRRTGHILIVILALLILGALFCGPAQAFSVTGGTDYQRAHTRDVIESCVIDYRVVDEALGEVEVIIEPHHEPYWEVLHDVWGLAWYANIRIRADVPAGSLGEVASHEWCHQIWFAMPYERRQEWVALCTEGIDYDSSNWYQNPAENFAECARVALFPSEYLLYTEPRTMLHKISPAETYAWIELWRWSHEQPFTDLASEDEELRAAAGYLSPHIIHGYTDGTFGPYQPLLKRHVALICERSGLDAPDWFDDYEPALRSDVADAIPGLTWLEERWDQTLTRSQLARLVYRKGGTHVTATAQ